MGVDRRTNELESEDMDSENLMKPPKNDDGTHLERSLQEGLGSVREQETKNGIGFHYLLINGYGVGDRILEGVYFRVSLKVEGLDAEITEVLPDESAYPYIENIRWENYVEGLRREVQHNINHLKNFYKDDNTTFEKEFDKYKEETGEENGAQMIMEV